MGHVADFGIALVGVITVGLIIWRDRTTSWQTVVGGVLLAAMIAMSGHDDLVIGTALVLTAVTLVQTIRGDAQLLHVNRPSQPGRSADVLEEGTLPLGQVGNLRSGGERR